MSHTDPLPDQSDLLRMQGEARLAIYEEMRALRELVEKADVDQRPPWHVAIEMNNKAHHVSVAVKNFGRLLPDTAAASDQTHSKTEDR